MAGHTRLYRRGAVYYHRAAIPVDIKDTYLPTEETFSLKTKDYKEALRLVRIAAVEVDRRFDEHRKKIREEASAPVLDELTPEQIKRLSDLYYAMWLEEDEATRMRRFGSQPKVPIELTADMDKEQIDQLVSDRFNRLPTFEEHQDDYTFIAEAARNDYARGEVGYYLGEAEEILSWENVNIRLNPKSESFPILARALQAAAIRAYNAIAQRDQGDPIETPLVEARTAPASATPLLSVAIEDWIPEKKRTSWVEKTETAHRVAVNQFISVAGDKPLDQYTKGDGRDFKATLMKLPANWNKYDQLKDLDLVRAAEQARTLGMKPMSDKNLNKIIGFVSSFWTWAEQQYEEGLSNPLKGLKIKLKKTAREERDPFTTAELQTIFSAPIYTGCQSHRQWIQPGQQVLNDSGMFWVPLISLFSGARAGEIIQLYIEDIKQDEGVLYLDINRDGEDKRLKNDSSRRRIPVHKKLLDIGFMQYVSKRKEQGGQRLFPDLVMGADGYYSSPFSKFFRRFLDSVGVKKKTNAFHSFRHTFEDACRNSDISHDVMDALQGHSQPGMSGRYGSGFSLEVLARGMERLNYTGLDLSHLYRLQVVSAEKAGNTQQG